MPEAHLATVLGALAMDLATGRPLQEERSAWRIVGAAVATLGIGLAAWSVAAAGQADLARPGRLVTGGPYAISRNPMYLAWHAMYCGLCLFTGSPWLRRLLPVVLLLTHLEIRKEERQLQRLFGGAYARYSAHVPRYL